MSAIPTPSSTAYIDAVLHRLQTLCNALCDGEPLPPLARPLPPEQSPAAQLQATFGLSEVELDILLLCLGATLDPQIAQACSTISGQPQLCPTLATATALFEDADWSLYSSANPLLTWRLVEFAAEFNPAHTPLRLDPRILSFLLGQTAPDPKLQGWVRLAPVPPAPDLPPSHQQLTNQILAAWSDAPSPLPLVQLTGPDASGQTAVVAAVSAELNWALGQLAVVNLPLNPADLAQLQTRWEREALLSRAILLLDATGFEQQDTERLAKLRQWLETLQSPVILIARDRLLRQQHRPLLNVELAPPTFAEQRHLWQEHLGSNAAGLEDAIDQLAQRFSLPPTAIQTACALAQPAEPAARSKVLWDYCRTTARPQLDDLAERHPCRATWDDLVLPDRQRQILLKIADQLRHQAQVYHKWGFARLGRGLGLSAVFHGPSGTGKTMTAEVLAGAFGLDLYRVDLAAVVSKYIGETEKNLRRIFDAAATGGVVLLFDEADALFGKRTEARDSRDRHANQEVSYLLQRMETYPGLAILTTNFFNAIDEAFLRRIRYVVKYAYPDAPHREEIWRRVFPSQTPTHDLRYDCLGILDLPGGNIRNIALNAAFAAAAEHNPVTMHYIQQATQLEYVKLGRSLTKKETKYWFD
ncbi:MAG: ATP-binding protein [Spirulina sp. SIO3F2]|nr:ATP-binding protein [Spirulina sp. SIO3F2]